MRCFHSLLLHVIFLSACAAAIILKMRNAHAYFNFWRDGRNSAIDIGFARLKEVPDYNF